jgi:hypothetical protein
LASSRKQVTPPSYATLLNKNNQHHPHTQGTFNLLNFCSFKIKTLYLHHKTSSNKIKGGFMYIIKSMIQFVANATYVFGRASKGQYHSDSEAIKELEREVLYGKSDRRNDAENLTNDRRNVAADIRKSFNKLVMENG